MREYLEYQGSMYYKSYGNWYFLSGARVNCEGTISKLERHFLTTYKSL